MVRAIADCSDPLIRHVTICQALRDEAPTCVTWSTRPIAHYIPRIGKPPGPMLDDYAQRIADGQAWVLEDAGRIVGILVLEETPAGLFCSTTSPCCQTVRARAMAAP